MGSPMPRTNGFTDKDPKLSAVPAHKPIYLQLRDEFIAKILHGDWRPGHVLENENELARRYSVSRGTIRQALQAIEDQGLVRRKKGQATVVSDPAADQQRERFDNLYAADGTRISGEVRQIDCRLMQPDTEARSALSLSAGDQVFDCRQIVEVDQKPFSYREIYVPVKEFPDAAMLDCWDVFAAAKRYEKRISRAFERVQLRRPNAAAAAALHVEMPVCLLVLDRIMLSYEGKPLEWLVSWTALTDAYYSVGIL